MKRIYFIALAIILVLETSNAQNIYNTGENNLINKEDKK